MVQDPNTGRRGRTAQDLRSGSTAGLTRPDELGRMSWTTATDRFPRGRPLSAVIWDFAAPLLGPPEDWVPEEVDIGLQLAVRIWNAVTLELSHSDPQPLLDLQRTVAGSEGELATAMLRTIEALRRSKIERFGADPRLILEHWLTVEDSDYHLRVSILDLDSA